MKTLIPIPKCVAMAFGVALVSLIAIPIPASAQVKGAAAAALTKHTQVGSSQAVAVKAEATSTRTCSKCQVTMVKVAERPAKTGAATEWKVIARNACPKCENVLATSGTDKLAKTVFAGSCEECCRENPMCCIVGADTCPMCPTVFAKK